MKQDNYTQLIDTLKNEAAKYLALTYYFGAPDTESKFHSKLSDAGKQNVLDRCNAIYEKWSDEIEVVRNSTPLGLITKVLSIPTPKKRRRGDGRLAMECRNKARAIADILKSELGEDYNHDELLMNAYNGMHVTDDMKLAVSLSMRVSDLGV